MNKVKKAVLVGVGVVSIGAAGIGVASNTFATTQAKDGQSSLIDALAKKFNLNKTDVQKVFQEQHAAHRTEMKAERETALKQALTDKKITQEQYNHIVAAWNEIDSAMESAGDRHSQTTEQREGIKAKMDALRDWMKAQNISPDTIGMRGPGGPGGHGGPDADRSQTTTSNSTTN